MKKLSGFQIIVLAVFGAFAVAAVLLFSFAIGNNSTVSTGPVVIWGTLDKNAFNDVLQQFAANDQRLTEVSYVQQDPATYEQTLTQALAAGKGPDLVIVSSEYASKDGPEFITLPQASLTQSQFQSLFADGTQVFMTPDGAVGVPVLIDPLVLYWNHDLLAADGFAQPPQYWDEVPAMAAKLTKKDNSGAITQSGIAFGGYDNIPAAKQILSALIMQAGGSITARDTGGNLVSGILRQSTVGVADPVQSALSFYTQFADPSQSDYSWNASEQDARSQFAAGTVALYVGLASDEALIKAMNPNLTFSASPLPQLRGVSALADSGVAYAFSVPRTAKNAQGAITVAYLLDTASTSNALAQVLGLASARRDVLSAPAQGSADLFNRMAIIMKSWADPDPAQTDALFRAMINDVVSGAITLQNAVQRADQQMTHIISPQ